jgi:IS30 family transposase
LRRNTGLKGYRPKQADWKSVHRKKTARKHIKLTKELRSDIIEKLQMEWSPEQISNHAKNNNLPCISHEWIYQMIDQDKANGGILNKSLRQSGRKRRKKYGKSGNKRGQIPNRRPISERPAYVNKRSTIGHWEGDTVIGKNHKGVIITLTERKSGFEIIEKVNTKNARVVADSIIKIMSNLSGIVKTITFDNGLEFAEHKRISQELNCRIYFADPYSSYQRGTNENTNGLLRQYFPKGSDFSLASREDIDKAMDRLNNRPRKRLNYQSPLEYLKRKGVALIT